MHVIREKPTSVRAGEEISEAAVTDYLKSKGLTRSNRVNLLQFPQGHSNLTYLVCDGVNEWVLRRGPHGPVAVRAHDMLREYRVLSAVHVAYPLAPRPIASCEDTSVIGSAFYLMERRRGTVLRHGTARLSQESMGALCREFVAQLVRLHQLDYTGTNCESIGRPAGYLARQVRGWVARYDAATTPGLPEMKRVGSWLASNVPTETDAAVIHNDYKFDNLLLDPDEPTRIVGVLDWEMATLGDPLSDFGFALAFWVQSDDPQDFQEAWTTPTTLPGSLTRAELVDQYAATRRRSVNDAVFYYVLGLYKAAVIFQQIYARHLHGQTRDERFAEMDQKVRGFARQAERALLAGRI